MSETLGQLWPRAPEPMQDFGLSGLGGNRLLATMPPADRSLLSPYLERARFDQGSVLQEPGEPITHAYFVESGLVSLLALLPDGRTIDTGSIGREGALGLMAGLGAKEAFTRAFVHIPISATRISVTRLAEAVARGKAVRDMIVRYTDSLLEQAQKITACNSVHHVSQRLCRWLLQAHDRTGDANLPLTQNCLAGVLGVQRTTVPTIGRELQTVGIIKVRRGRIQIRDIKALERRACTCHRSRRNRDT